MPSRGNRVSHAVYEKRLESIQTALIRGFTDPEVMTAEKISRSTLYRYKRTINRRRLKGYPQLAVEAKKHFMVQLQRWEDVIRQANRKIMSGQAKIAPLLRVINNSTKNILDYMFRAGLIAEVPKEIRLKGDVDLSVIKNTLAGFIDGLGAEDIEQAKHLREVLRIIKDAELKKIKDDALPNE